MPTMKVRILSGSQAGAVLEMDQTEAEAGLASGFLGSLEPEVIIIAEPKPPARDPDVVHRGEEEAAISEAKSERPTRKTKKEFDE